jgi:hypothetical protein
MSDLIEAMAIAMCQSALGGERCPCAEIGEFRCRDAYPGEQAIVALNALREVLVPVGWEYWPSAETDELPFMQPNRANMDPRYWTETPLFALPEIDNG